MSSGPHKIRFLVYDPLLLAEGAGDAAHFLNTDDNPMRGDIRLLTPSGGTPPAGAAELVGTFVDDDFAALSVPVRAGRAGLLHLQTCILAGRDQPYGLIIELARHRIKHFIQKCEEWQMWDPGLSRGAMRMWDEARSLFAEALLEADPVRSERVAQRSLERAIEASEHLAMSHAEILLHRRFGTRAASSTTMGTVIRPSIPPSAAMETVLQRDFDVLHVRADWRAIESKRGKPDFAQLDRWIAWAAERKKPVMLGPLLDLREEALPDHARVYRHDYESFRNLAYDHLDRIAERYTTSVGIWNVGSGFHANAFLELSPEQMIDLSRRVVLLIRQRNRRANTLMELVDLFGEQAAKCPAPILPWRFAELLQQEGISISALGLRMVLGRRGNVARDLFQVSCMLDRFLGREARVMLSAFGLPSTNVDPRGGWWREGCTPETQASWAGRVVSVSLSKPFIETTIWADAADGDPASSGFGLLTQAGTAQPVVAKLAGIRRKLRAPLGPRKSDSEGADARGGELPSKTDREGGRGLHD